MNATFPEVVTKVSPGLESRIVFGGDAGDVEQHRFASLLFSQSHEMLGIHARRRKQLRRSAERIEIVGMLVETQRNADFFIGDCSIVWRQGWIEGALVVFCATFHRDFQQPFHQTLTRATLPREAQCETGDVLSVAEPASECLLRWLVV